MRSYSDNYCGHLEGPSEDELRKLLDIAYIFKKAVANGDRQTLQTLEQNRTLLITLLNYLAQLPQISAVEAELVIFLKELLGVDLGRGEDRETELEEEEERLTEVEKKRRHLLLVYKVHQMLNPKQLAGETAWKNFVDNVMTHGMQVALENATGEVAQYFSKKELLKLESHKHQIMAVINGNGFFGGKGK